MMPHRIQHNMVSHSGPSGPGDITPRGWCGITFQRGLFYALTDAGAGLPALEYIGLVATGGSVNPAPVRYDTAPA